MRKGQSPFSESLGVSRTIVPSRERSAVQKIAHRVLIEAPVHEAFEYASNWQCWPDWFVGFKDVSSIAEVDRGNGAIYDYKMWILGIPFRCQTEIHDFVENKGWSGRRVKGVPHRTKWIFEDLGTRTNLTYVVEYSLPLSILGPILYALFTNPAWRRILRKSLNNLAAHFQR